MPEERHGRRPEAYPPAHASVVRLRAARNQPNVASLGRYKAPFRATPYQLQRRGGSKERSEVKEGGGRAKSTAARVSTPSKREELPYLQGWQG